MPIIENFNLKELNTFGLNITTSYYFSFTHINEIKSFISSKMYTDMPYLFIGAGSNLLFKDNYKGVTIHSKLTDIKTINETEDFVFIKAGSGVIWDDFVEFCVTNNYGGVENLSHIPGTVGAAPVQNVGAYGIEAKDVIHNVEAIEYESGKIVSFTNNECNFEYRNSIFKNSLKGKVLITNVTFKLTKKHTYNTKYGNIKTYMQENNLTENIQNIRKSIIAIRDIKLPDHNVVGNAGSFFKNPYVPNHVAKTLLHEYPNMPNYPAETGETKIPAAWLIDSCNWKGKTHKGAGVYHNQPLVLINQNNATGNDIIELSNLIIDSVKKRFNITLEREVNII